MWYLWNKRHSYGSASQNPAERAEYNGLQQPQQVEDTEALQQQAVAGEVDGEGAVDGHAHHEQEEPHAVAHADAVVDERAVVVEVGHAALADAAVFSPVELPGYIII